MILPQHQPAVKMIQLQTNIHTHTTNVEITILLPTNKIKKRTNKKLLTGDNEVLSEYKTMGMLLLYTCIYTFISTVSFSVFLTFII